MSDTLLCRECFDRKFPVVLFFALGAIEFVARLLVRFKANSALVCDGLPIAGRIKFDSLLLVAFYLRKAFFFEDDDLLSFLEKELLSNPVRCLAPLHRRLKTHRILICKTSLPTLPPISRLI